MIFGLLLVPIFYGLEYLNSKETQEEVFYYKIQIRDSVDLHNIAFTKIILEINAITPMGNYTDSNGFAIFNIKKDSMKKHGRIIVEKNGYQTFIEKIYITEENDYVLILMHK